MLWVIFVGLVAGFLGSVPVAGPVAVLVLRAGLTGQYREGRAIAAGSALAEGLYGGMAFAGVGLAMGRYPMLAKISGMVAALMLVAVGIALLLSRAPQALPVGSIPPRRRGKFWLGLSVTALNPTILLSWSTVITTLYGAGLLARASHGALSFGTGVGVGVMLWFVAMLWLLDRHRGRVSPATLHRGVHAAGGLLLLGGLWMAGARVLLYLQSAG